MQKIKSRIGKIFLSEEISVSLVEKIIEKHMENMEKGRDVLKRDKKRQLSRVKEGERSYVVKEFKKPGPWWIFRPDAISWRNSIFLKKRNIPVPKVFAWIKEKRGFIIMEDLGDNVLGPLLKRLSPFSAYRKYLIKETARLVSYIHSKNLIYGDLKLTNIIIKDEKLFLVDMDRIKIKRRIELKDRLYNISQVFKTFPEDITEEEIELFLNTYFQR